MQIPDWVRTARKPQDLHRAAEILQGLDSLEALPPLARLSRVAPGWLFIEVSALLVVLLSLAVWFLLTASLAVGVWGVAEALRLGEHLLHPWLRRTWFAVPTILTGLTVAFDHRLRNLLVDEEHERFDLAPDELTWVWVAVLSPLRIGAQAMRVLGALLTFTITLVPVTLGALVIAGCWSAWSEQGYLSSDTVLTPGCVALLLYLLFGLFIFSDWPRQRRASLHSERVSAWVRLLRLGLAVVIAAALGTAVARMSPVHKQPAGYLSAVLYFLLSYRWLTRWSFSGLKDLKRLGKLRVGWTQRQTRFLKVNVWLLGLLGLGGVGLQWGADVAFWLATAALIYPIGLGVALARPLALPYFRMRRAALRMVTRIRARLAIARAVKAHRLRNRDLVGKRGEHAICRTHLARFERQHVRLAYGRRLSFWSCRVCHRDREAIADARIVRGIFDGQVTGEDLVQKDDVLLVNLLSVGDPLPLPLDLSEVHVSTVSDPHDIERFIVAYQNAAFPVKVPRLDEIRLTILPDADLDLNIRNMLSSHFRN